MHEFAVGCCSRALGPDFVLVSLFAVLGLVHISAGSVSPPTINLTNTCEVKVV